MLKIYFVLFFLAVCTITNAQDIEKYVKATTIPVRTNSPDSLDFSDLEAIGNAIGDAKIVMLGEQDHGDAPTFLAKTRIIKYLHEKKGFDVLAFESDFFALNEGWDALPKNPTSVDSFIHRNIFPIWTGCNTCKDLFHNYIPSSYNSLHPLIISGFDNQMVLAYSSKNLIKKLDSAFRSYKLSATTEPDYNAHMLPLFDSLTHWYGAQREEAVFGTIIGYLDKINIQLAAKTLPQDFWPMIINNLLAEAEEYKHVKKGFDKLNQPRDKQMALNLQWLSSVKYQGKKIIVWAANYHVSKFGHDFLHTDSSNAITMGSFFTHDPEILRNTYIIGFNSYDGTAGRLGMKDYKVPPPRKNGFETWIPEQYEYAFTDLRPFNVSHPVNPERFFMKGLGHQSMKTNWSSVFDGVFFVRHMYPCVKK